MSKYFFSLLLLLAFLQQATAQETPVDTTHKTPQKKPAVLADGHQLRFGIDLGKPVINLMSDQRKNYEFLIDYYYKKEIYFVAEGGFGNATVDYPDLRYKTNSSFIKIGLDKSMLQRLLPGDWDVVFVGMRYGLGIVNRGSAAYMTNDSLWGITTGTVPAHSYLAHWAEINAGIRLEIIRNIFIGWNLRAKFMLNPKTFEELSPAYIAGYGKGDKSTAFDFNFYISYALRWGANKTAAVNSSRSR